MEFNRDYCRTPPTTTNGVATTTPSSTGSTYGLFKHIDTTPSPLTASKTMDKYTICPKTPDLAVLSAN